MNIVDLFSGDAFSVLSLSTAINLVPNQYGRVNALGIFASESTDTTIVAIELENGVLNLIPSTKRGTPNPVNKKGKRELKPFVVPHLGLDDKLYPSDIQNVRAFGGLSLKTVEGEVNKRLMAMARKHDITLEYLKCGALTGVIKDADGTTLFNLFDEFDVTQKSVDFDLSNDSSDVSGHAREVSAHIEDNLMGDSMTHVHALCSPGFFAEFIAHDAVREAYLSAQSVQTISRNAEKNPLRDNVSKGFWFQDIFWEEYRGQAPVIDNDGAATTRHFIPANSARFFPMGTSETFKVYNAPADWMETANTPGLPKYGKVVPEGGGRYAEILTESNPLPLCLRPAILVEGTIT